MSIFTKTQMSKPNYSTFNLSHQKKLSCNMGQLIPVMCMETLPGDVFSSQTAQLVRFAPMIAPMMHQVSIYTHFFYVPNRILWDNWESFFAKGEDGLQEPVFPTITPASFETSVGSLFDYFGIPTGYQGPINALPFAAYNKIYNEYFRDQNLITEIGDECVDGANNGVIDAVIKRRAWQHDYFTSALPFVQKGPQATIPLGTDAPIEFIGTSGSITTKLSAGGLTASGPANIELDASGDISTSVAAIAFDVDNSQALQADLSGATAASIIDLRNAFKLQEWLEKNARGGSRYIESIMIHFGVSTGDARVNRPEFLGGGSTPLSVSEVLQTSNAATQTTPQGNMAGHGISAGQSSSWKYRCKEHGFIIGLMSIMPKTAYQNGLEKFWFKDDTFDYYFPSFAHIGEQPILSKELFADGGPSDDDVFGYTPRYAEYKYINDNVHGEFKTTLDFWHLGRIFATRPLLNESFINCEPSPRIFANQTGEQCYVHIYHNVKARRPMPYFGNPKI